MGLIAGGFALLGLVVGLVLGGGVGAVAGLLIGLVVGEIVFMVAASILEGRLLEPTNLTEPANDHSPN